LELPPPPSELLFTVWWWALVEALKLKLPSLLAVCCCLNVLTRVYSDTNDSNAIAPQINK
jgi:hypothetical protein